MTVLRTRTALIWLVLLTGCGLGDYEAQMRKTQERVKLFDEENKQLGDPLPVPQEVDPKTNASRPVADVFIRLPRNISAKVGPLRAGGLPYRFASTSTGPVTAVELAFGKGEDDLAAKLPGWFPGATVPTLQKRAEGPTAFQVAEFDYSDTQSVAAYVTPAQKGQTQVAVVYWMDKSKKAQATPIITMSLRSLAVDGAASTRQVNYASRSPFKPGGRN